MNIIPVLVIGLVLIMVILFFIVDYYIYKFLGVSDFYSAVKKEGIFFRWKVISSNPNNCTKLQRMYLKRCKIFLTIALLSFFATAAFSAYIAFIEN